MAWIVKDSTAAPPRRDEPYLTQQMKQELEAKYAHRYPTRKAMALPVLHAVQHEVGWLPPQALEEAAAFLEIEASELYDTASFYEEFFLHPKGKNVVWVCQSVSCEIMGEAAITDAISKKLGIDPEQTTDDGDITLMKVECIGACGGAPCALVNETLHENLTPETAPGIVDNINGH